MVNSPLVTVTKGHQRNVLKTLSRRPSVLATLITTSGRHLQQIVRPETASSPPLRTPAEPTSGRNTAGGRSRESQQPYQTFNCSRSGRTCLFRIVNGLFHKSSFVKSSQEGEYVYMRERERERERDLNWFSSNIIIIPY